MHDLYADHLFLSTRAIPAGACLAGLTVPLSTCANPATAAAKPHVEPPTPMTLAAPSSALAEAPRIVLTALPQIVFTNTLYFLI